ncbi:MAG: Holliday junction resolvase RuvX [Pirellulaceae bacterium]|jgi:putative Holliday junction resolvase|nr:Holliday junction resolvase RuvX [Pirellulaceae bacterium]MDP7017391.1 Holliday junction resolvase RuvX [Pirellulaceae bacterium]
MNGLPASGRLAGVDHGAVRIGVSICDVQQTMASPYENYARRSESQDADYFRQLVRDERVVGFVVGLPLHSSGDESQQSAAARKFGEWLERLTETPVHFYDERFSSAAADDYLLDANLSSKQRKKRRDMLAAQVILASFLESDRTGEGGGALD